jgi:hypothetical protein
VWGNKPSHSQGNSHFGELESRWTPEFSESNCRGQNPMDRKVLDTIGNILDFFFKKWAHMTHLDIWNTSYGQKKGRESNRQFDSWPLKIKNCSDFLTCRWHATYRWKALDEGYNFVSYLISIEGLHAKLWGPKVTEVPTLGISGLPLGNPGTKCHLDVGLVVSHIIYYKGEVVATPKSGPWWVLWVRVCSWFILAPKVFWLCTNQFVVWRV